MEENSKGSCSINEDRLNLIGRSAKGWNNQEEEIAGYKRISKRFLVTSKNELLQNELRYTVDIDFANAIPQYPL